MKHPLPGAKPTGRELVCESREFPDRTVSLDQDGSGAVYGEDRGLKYGSQHFSRYFPAPKEDEAK